MDEYERRVMAAGLKLKGLYSLYVSRYRSDLSYGEWISAVKRPLVKFQYITAVRTDKILKEAEAMRDAEP